MMKRGFLLAVAVFCLLLPSAAQDAPVAKVGKRTITYAELEKAAAAQLKQLEAQKRKILETTLEQLVERTLLEVAAEEKGVGVDALFPAAAEVTDAEVDAWYEENQARVRQPKEQVAEQIRNFLAQQREQEARSGVLRALRAKYAVHILLEPQREKVAAGASPTRGPGNAPVTIVVFSDFECPFCSRLPPTLDQVREKYGDKVRIAFRQFPLAMHANAPKAAEASLCAREQGKFWEMHDAMFADQRNLGVDSLKAKAAAIGLDSAKFDASLDSGRFAAEVAADLEDGQAAGVTGTPAMFVNGRLVSGAVPYDQVAELVDDELARKGAK